MTKLGFLLTALLLISLLLLHLTLKEKSYYEGYRAGWNAALQTTYEADLSRIVRAHNGSHTIDTLRWIDSCWRLVSDSSKCADTLKTTAILEFPK